MKFSHAVIESDDAVVILVREAGAAGVDITLYALHVFQVVGYDRSAFPRGDEFARLKAESSQISHRTRAFSLPHSAVGMRAIFDDFQVVFCGNAKDFVHVRKTHTQMDGENRLGLRRNGPLDQLRVETIGVRIDVHEYGNGIDQQHRPNGSLPGVGRGNDFVAGSYVNRFQSCLDRNRSGIHALGVLGGVNLGEFLGKG